MPLKDLFDYISKEWNTLTAAPVTFLLVLAFAVSLSWWVINWIYEKRFETLKERQASDDRELTRKAEELKRRSQHYEERLAGKDEKLREQAQSYEERLARKNEEITAKQRQIDEYKERLGILEAKTKYHSFTNSDLKDRALVLVSNIRCFLEREQGEYNNLLIGEHRVVRSEEEYQEIWNRHTNAQMQHSSKTNSEYDKHFKIETILLRNEIISRLPWSAQKSSLDELMEHRYEYPTNSMGMRAVADNLERLAKSIAE